MSYQALHDEIVNDPLVRDYASMTNQEKADDMHEKRYTKDVESMSVTLNTLTMERYSLEAL